jgi:Mrp family chromosome partitioning ATPase
MSGKGGVGKSSVAGLLACALRRRGSRVGILLVTSPQDLAGMVVRKAAHMAEQLGVRLYGLVENMSYLRCPQCRCRIDLFGTSRAEKTVEECGVSMLGHLPLDPELAVKCDRGSIEDYESETFEGIAERVLEAAGLGLKDAGLSEA